MTRAPLILALAATALAGIGCASKEEPATAFVTATESEIAEIRPDAAKFAPQELQKAEAALAKVKQHFAKEEYKEVLEGAPQLTAEVGALKEIVVAKQTQFAAATHEWERLSAEVPPMITSIENQVDSLSRARLPKEVTKEAFEAAKLDLATMKSTWTEAKAAFDAGDATQAADKGRAVETKAKETGVKLGMSPV